MQHRCLALLPLLPLFLACAGSGPSTPAASVSRPATSQAGKAPARKPADPPADPAHLPSGPGSQADAASRNQHPAFGPSSSVRLLERQCRAVAQKLATWRQAYPGGEALLLLGAPPEGDLQRFSRPGTFAVLLDKAGIPLGAAPEPGPAMGILTADFNALADLDLIMGHFASAFDQVGFDANVVYFTQWTREHLGRVRELLAPEGIFVATAMWHTFAPGPLPMPAGLSLDGDPRHVLEAAAAALTPLSADDSLLPGAGLRIPMRLQAYIHQRGLQDAWKRAVRTQLRNHVTRNLRATFRTVTVRTERPWYVPVGDPWTLYVCRR